MTAFSSTQLDTVEPAEHRPSTPGPRWSVVVGFDGSEPSRAALEFATELILGRDGHLEVVYVAHLSSTEMMSAASIVGGRESLDEIATQLDETARLALQGREPRWHFERRDGAVADELLAAARRLRRRHDPDSVVVIVVGSAEQLRHHLIGSTAAALTHEREFPLMVVPATTGAPRPVSDDDETTGGNPASRLGSDEDVRHAIGAGQVGVRST